MIRSTDFHFSAEVSRYQGKVRDVYRWQNRLAIVATDRVSAFDVILPKTIPYKGQVLNQISGFFMQETADICPSWLEAQPEPSLSVGKYCEALPVEMVIRGYLVGSAWRAYRDGQRVFNGYRLPEGLQENGKLPEAIITPSTKAAQGEHDEEISETEIIAQGLVSAQVYEQLKAYTFALFARGQALAEAKGLILADTKYEFGLWQEEVYLIDEIHTPDSSRYFDIEGYEARQKAGEPQPQRSKEMLRQWLISQGFQGKSGQSIPEMSEEIVQAISQEYIRIYEQITGKTFQKLAKTENQLLRIEQAIKKYLNL